MQNRPLPLQMNEKHVVRSSCVRNARIDLLPLALRAFCSPLEPISQLLCVHSTRANFIANVILLINHFCTLFSRLLSQFALLVNHLYLTLGFERTGQFATKETIGPIVISIGEPNRIRDCYFLFCHVQSNWRAISR